MNDIVEIQQVVNRYSVCASARDWEGLLATYAEEGVWEVPTLGKLVEGRAAIREALVEMTTGTDYVIQQNSPGVITVDGDRATARSVICENGKVAGKGEAFQALGYYADDLVRRDGGWQFVRRRFELVSMRNFEWTGHLVGV